MRRPDAESLAMIRDLHTPASRPAIGHPVCKVCGPATWPCDTYHLASGHGDPSWCARDGWCNHLDEPYG